MNKYNVIFSDSIVVKDDGDVFYSVDDAIEQLKSIWGDIMYSFNIEPTIEENDGLVVARISHIFKDILADNIVAAKFKLENKYKYVGLSRHYLSEYK